MADSAVMCPDHPEEKLRFVCVVCDRLVCRDCKLTDHEGHRSVDLAKTAADIRHKLQGHVERVDERMKVLDVVSEEAEEDKRAAMSAKKDIEEEIRRRAAMMTEWARQFQQQALESLEVTMNLVTADIDTSVRDLEQRRGVIKDMLQSPRALLADMDQGAAVNLAMAFTLERDLGSGRGKGENLEILTECLPLFSVRPVLHRPVSLTDDTARMFIGVPQFAQVSKGSPRVMVSHLFTCVAAINSICPMADGTVWLAHDIREGFNDQRVALYSQQGRLLHEETVSSRVSLVRVEKNRVFASGKHVAKIISPSESHSVILEKDYGNDLYNTPSQKADGVLAVSSKLNLRYAIMSSQATDTHHVCKLEVKQSPLPLAASTHIRAVDCPRPLAMDVDSSGKRLAMVTSDQAVRVFHLSDQQPAGVYCPTGETFSPSDVCFHTIGGKEVLLVADSLNSVVNILEYRDSIRFQSYFGAGCPLLEGPAALSPDDIGRLWVGCKNGRVLACCVADGSE